MQVNLIDWRKKQQKRLSCHFVLKLFIMTLFTFVALAKLAQSNAREQQLLAERITQLTTQKNELSLHREQLKEKLLRQQQQRQQHAQMLHKQQQINGLLNLLNNREQSLWFHHITLNQHLHISGAAFNYRDILALHQRVAKLDTIATTTLTTTQANTSLSPLYLPHFTFTVTSKRPDDVNPLI